MSYKLQTFFILTLQVIFLNASYVFGQNVRSYELSKTIAYEEGVVIVKLSKEYTKSALNSAPESHLTSNSFRKILAVQSVKSIDVHNSNKTSQRAETSQIKSRFINNIYKIKLEKGKDVAQAINLLLAYDNVVYAEPLFLERPLVVPNDPNVNFQDYLSVIKAFDAWDITQGDPKVVIGISDTGVQLDNADLVGNIQTNDLDPVNGIDDDGNGYVDDFMGWDFADDDNDPSADFSGHGTHVAGVSSATTDNNQGISGVGYNSKMVPLKIFQSSNGLSNNSYESVLYAADQGYAVINLSWGSVGSYSEFNQDVINYAVLEKGVVVVAAAGNTNAELDFYPASYDHVISVGASDASDNKADFATYSYHIDLVAPGASVYSTRNGNSFSAQPGSSFAAPQVAGAAALVKTIFPEYSALQIAEQLRVTSDDIYGVGNNQLYEGQLGSGRLNVFRAVSEKNHKSLRLEAFDYANGFGNFAFFDDSVKLSLNFTNYLLPIESGSVRFSSASPYISFLEDEVYLGALSELQTTGTLSTNVYLSENTPANHRVVIKLDYEDNGYDDYQFIEFTTNPDFLALQTPALGTTISSDGNVGYADDSVRNGIGLIFEGVRIARHMGIMIGNDEGAVSDNVVNSYQGFGQEIDFNTIQDVKYYDGSQADTYARSEFDDSAAGATQMGLMIEQEYLGWNDAASENFMVVEYRVTNNTQVQKKDLSFGFFTDWNLGNANANRIVWDEERQFGYAFDVESGEYFAGIALLSNQETNFYGVNVGAFNGNEEDIEIVVSDALKHSFLTSEKLSAGDTGDGNDIASVLTAKIKSLKDYQSEKVTFVIMAGASIAELESSLARARSNYEDFLNAPPIDQTEIACFNEAYTLRLSGGTSFELYSDAEGSNLIFTGNDFEMTALSNDSIFFTRNIDSLYQTDIRSVKVLVSDPVPDFTLNYDTLIIGDVPRNEVEFTDASFDAISWFWDFGNGLTSTLQYPKVSFSNPGNYLIALSIKSSMGCTASITKELVVSERSALPTIEDQVVCAGTMVEIIAANSTELNLYILKDDIEPILSGNKFTVGPIDRDTVFYVSSSAGLFESDLATVSIDLDAINADFEYGPDTTNLESSQLISFTNRSENETTYSWSVDGSVISGLEHAQYEFDSENEIQVSLAVQSMRGCNSVKDELVKLEVSSSPTVEDLSICKFSSTEILPNNGSVFYFYADESLNSLVYKGRQLMTGPLSADTIFYVTGADKFKESDPVTVNVDIIPFETTITADPDTLYLENGRNVTFMSPNEDITFWRWSIEGRDYTETFSTPTFSFDAVGIYGVQLIAENSLFCVDTTMLNYVVMAPITSIERDLLDLVSLFPNPASKYFKITFEGELPFQHLGIFDVMGRELKKVSLEGVRNELIVDISELPPGLFVVKNYNSNMPYSTRLIISK